MKPITIRGVSEETAEYLRREASRKKLSLNKVAVSLLEKGAGCEPIKTPGPAPHHDLDDLFGAWTEAEGKEFEESVRDLRAIDEGIWTGTR